MRITKSSASVLALCFIMLVANASAAYNVLLDGGVGSSSANGGTSGSEGKLVYDSGKLSDGTGNFDNILSEYIYANANIANSNTGEATAQFYTNGEKTRTEYVAYPGYLRKLSVALDGIANVSVSKTSNEGSAFAEAGMYTRAAVGTNFMAPFGTIGAYALGGEAGQYARIFNSGQGGATAFTKGKASFQVQDPVFGDYSVGSANGEIYLTGANKESQPVSGGSISGYGEISTLTWLNNPNFVAAGGMEGISTQTEWLQLNAGRGVSFPGESNVVGRLSGSEMGETYYNTRPGFEGGFIVDSEANTDLNGEAHAYKVRDLASTNVIVRPTTKILRNEILPAGSVFDSVSDVYIDAYAKAERRMPGDIKAWAEGYITKADWTTSSKTHDGRLSSVSGEIGQINDGLPLPLMGFGTGAWIQNPFATPVTADVGYRQFASTALTIAPEMSSEYWLKLDGMAYTGKMNDAVGAFGAVKNLYASVNIPLYSQNTVHFKDIKAINWLEGSDKKLDHKHAENTPGLINATYSDAVSRGIMYTYGQWVNA